MLHHGGITNNARLVFEAAGITPGEAAVNPRWSRPRPGGHGPGRVVTAPAG